MERYNLTPILLTVEDLMIKIPIYEYSLPEAQNSVSRNPIYLFISTFFFSMPHSSGINRPIHLVNKLQFAQDEMGKNSGRVLEDGSYLNLFPLCPM